MRDSTLAVGASVDTLRRVAELYGTPTYAYDIGRIRNQVSAVRRSLPAEIDLLYSVKANPSLGLCNLMAGWGLGADVASAGELLLAIEAGIEPHRICVNGPYKSRETVERLHSVPAAVLSVDSVSELQRIATLKVPNRILLRLRPDFGSRACCGVDSESRFGIPFDQLAACREVSERAGAAVAGFHVFSGSQMSDAATVIHHLVESGKLVMRAADAMAVTPEVVNLGGGFGVPYGARDQELDLDAIGTALSTIVEQFRPARVVLELGRYLVAQAGWYLTTVVGHQTLRGRPAAVVDGGVHHRADICNLGVFARGAPPLVLRDSHVHETTPTDVLGCLCLPYDVLLEAVPLPSVNVGDVLALPNGGAYGLSAAPITFLSHPGPAEVAFEGSDFELLRARETTAALLRGQSHLRHVGKAHLH